MVEKCPKYNSTASSISLTVYSEYQQAFEKANQNYLYWDKVKYLSPKGLKAEDFWNAVQHSRRFWASSFSFPCCEFFFRETSAMQELLHLFDMHFGGTLASSNIISEKNRQYYLLSSIMEEAIASSQMEGASTTRKVAKEMLRKQAKPKDKSQQMIVNNYKTIRFVSEHKNDDLTPELLLEIHRQITEKTLDDSNDEGRFRTDDNIFIVNGITGEVAHEPPACSLIKKSVRQICNFVNNEKGKFIHPIIKAIILHFLISYLHPFVDGNGRTARSLFYWFILKKGYWLTEFLSISRIIYKSKVQYEKAFLYTEQDDFDLGYFIHYNLKVLKQAFEELQLYLERKSKEEHAILEYRIPILNERQMQLVKMYSDRPSSVFTSKDLQTRFNVSVKTIRSDLEGLVQEGLLEPLAMNKRLVGYARSNNFELRLREIKGN